MVIIVTVINDGYNSDSNNSDSNNKNRNNSDRSNSDIFQKKQHDAFTTDKMLEGQHFAILAMFNSS